MNMWWWILYGGSYVVFGFDLVLELSKKRTITDYVRSPAVGMLFLVGWLMGHFTE